MTSQVSILFPPQMISLEKPFINKNIFKAKSILVGFGKVMIDLVRLGQVRLCQGKFGLVGFGKDRLG